MVFKSLQYFFSFFLLNIALILLDVHYFDAESSEKNNCHRQNAQNYFFFRKQMAVILYFVIFHRTEITFIQVILTPYFKLRDVVNNIFSVPLYKLSKWGLHRYIFNVNDFVFSISQGFKKTYFQ